MRHLSCVKNDRAYGEAKANISDFSPLAHNSLTKRVPAAPSWEALNCSTKRRPFKAPPEPLRFIVIAGCKLAAAVDFDFFNALFSPAFEESVPADGGWTLDAIPARLQADGLVRGQAVVDTEKRRH